MSRHSPFPAPTSTEQRALADSVERFLRDRYPLDRRRQTIASGTGFDRDTWSAFAEMGWLSIPFRDEDGGLGGDPQDLAMVVGGLGEGAVLEPYLHAVVLAGSLLAAAPPGALRNTLIDATITGQGIATLATTDRGSRACNHFKGIEARRGKNGVVLHGHLVFVPFAAEADMILVPAAHPDAPGEGLRIYGVRPSEAELRAYPTVDGGRAADVILQGVPVADSRLLAGPEHAAELLDNALRLATWCACVEAVAIMKALIRCTVGYLKTRRQFGQAIADFQVPRHAVADMGIDFSHAEATTWLAGQQFDGGDTALLDRLLAAAKYDVGRAGRRIGQRAVQLHGGIGMTDELIVGHYFKRLIGIDLLYGGWQHSLQSFVNPAH